MKGMLTCTPVCLNTCKVGVATMENIVHGDVLVALPQ